MNAAATIHALQQSNLTLHERLKALSRQRDAFRELCVEAKGFVDQFVTPPPSPWGPDQKTIQTAIEQAANQLDAALESALALHR